MDRLLALAPPVVLGDDATLRAILTDHTASPAAADALLLRLAEARRAGPVARSLVHPDGDDACGWRLRVIYAR